jgi:signal transduction histidine kinase
MNRGLAITLISNLLKNAIVHNHSGGTVSIKIENKSISIINTGHNKALNPEYVFKRFYRDGNNEHSTGLGLSIVNSIVTNYKLSVTYSYNGNHIFKIIFP